MFVDASIITDSTFSDALPSGSIIDVNGAPYILVLVKKEGDTYYFKQEEVEVKESYDGFSVIENKNGFKPNTQFLTKGAFNLLGD